MRVLRLDPIRVAQPRDSVVITFDRPVAPKLDRSVDPRRAVRISPAVPTRAYWRDPSTLVIAFERPWPYGAEFRVDFVRTLRSADGHALKAGQGLAIPVRGPMMLAVWPSLRADGRVATVQRPRVVLEAAPPLLSLVGRSWLVPFRCGWQRDSIPLTPESITPLDTAQARGFGASRGGLDSLRRVVQFSADRELPRACSFIVSLPSVLVDASSDELHSEQ